MQRIISGWGQLPALKWGRFTQHRNLWLKMTKSTVCTGHSSPWPRVSECPYFQGSPFSKKFIILSLKPISFSNCKTTDILENPEDSAQNCFLCCGDNDVKKGRQSPWFLVLFRLQWYVIIPQPPINQNMHREQFFFFCLYFF